MSETRNRIEEHVQTNPGVHFNEIVRRLDLAPGQVQYHVRQLLGAESLTEEKLYGRTHYYPPEFDPWERSLLALVRRETTRDVLGYLLANDDAAPGTVADAVGVARSTLEWHLDHLVEQNVVEKSYDQGGRVTLSLSHPRKTARLLEQVSPSLPERFVDRFMRLVDDLLSEQSS